MPFTAAVTHEGDWRVARCLEVEVASQGHTVDEALANLREALELYYEDEAFLRISSLRSSPPSNCRREPGAAGRIRRAGRHRS